MGEDGLGVIGEVSIPSWTTNRYDGEDGVILYRVEVGASDGAPHPHRTAERRFSDFQRLNRMLCDLHAEAMRGFPFPARRRKSSGGAVERVGRDVVEARRVELEAWLRGLASDAAIARAPPFVAFLQLERPQKQARSRRAAPMAPTSAPGVAGSASDAADAAHLRAILASETATKELLARKVAELEEALAASEASAGEAVAAAEAAGAARARDLEAQVQSAEEQAKRAQADADAAVRDAREAASLREELEARARRAEEEAAAAREDARSRRADDAKAKQDLRTLSREIKRLGIEAATNERTHQAAQAGAVRAAEADASLRARAGALLHEARVLHRRIQGCAVDVLLRNADEDGSHLSSGGFEVPTAEAIEDGFQLSENRITCLLAEVELLVSSSPNANKLTNKQTIPHYGPNKHACL